MNRIHIPCDAETSAGLALGLAACGHAGAWNVDLDETVQGPQKWFLQIEGPSVYLYFEIATPGAIEDLIGLLERPLSISVSGDTPLETSQAHSALALGEFFGKPITWLRDSENDDRMFVLIRGSSPSALRIAIEGQGFADFLDALRQTRDELRHEGTISGRPQ